METILVCEICVVHGFNFMLNYWFCICVADFGKHANPQGWTTLYEPTHGKCENGGQNGTQKMSFLENVVVHDRLIANMLVLHLF